jgi:hypothetical protein
MRHVFSFGRSLAALLLLAAAPAVAQAQTGSVGIGTTAPDASAALDIVSTSKGLLLPRVAAATGIASPAPGLLVYQTGSPAGFYYNSGTAAAPAWQQLATAGSTTADNLGNHTATQSLNLNGQKLTGGGSNGLRVRASGGVVVDTLAGTGKGRFVTAAPDGTLQASAPLQTQALPSTAPDTPPRLLNEVAVRNASLVALNTANTRAYVLGIGDTLKTFDVSGSGPPVLLGKVRILSAAVTLVLNAAGTRAFVTSDIDYRLQVLDISGPGSAVVMGSTPTGMRALGLALNAAGTRAFVVNLSLAELAVFDVSDGNNPVRLGTTGIANGVTSVAANAAGTRAYVVGDGNRLQAFSVSSSGTPTYLGRYATTSDNYGQVLLNAAGTRAYVLGYDNNSLQTFDVTETTPPNPMTPLPVPVGGPVPTGNRPMFMALNATNTRAYVLNSSSSTLQTFDISGSGAPVSVGTPVATRSNPRCVALNAAGTRAYVVARSALQVFDLGPPPPTVVGIGSDGSLGTLTLAQLADNLGNHTATRNLNLATYQLVGNGGSSGLAIGSGGNVGIGTTTPSQKLDVNGTSNVSGNSYVGGSLGLGTSSPAGQLANTATNVLGTDGNGISGQGLGWASTTAAGYAGVFYNANNAANAPGLAVKIASASAPALDVSQGAAAGTAGTSLLRVNGNGQVGIGTSIPGATLEVAGSSSTVKLAGLAGSSARMVTAAADGTLGTATIPVNTDAQQLTKTGSIISLTNGGSVTDADNQALSLSGSILSLTNGGSVTVPDAQQLTISGSTISLTNGGSVTVPSSADNLGNHTATRRLDLAAFPLVGNGGTAGLSISSAGQVGIGTTGPATSTLDVRTTDASAALTVGSTGGGAGALYLGNANHGLKRNYNGSGNDVGLYTTSGTVYLSASNGMPSTSQFALTTGGNVGIGLNNPAALLHVGGVALFGGGTLPTTTNATGIGWNAVNVNVGESEFYNYRGSGGGGFRFFSINGTAAPTNSNQIAFINTAGAYSALSDRRVKTNITPLGQGLCTVLALRPVSYDFHTSRRLQDGVVTFLSDDKTVRALGFVAQDLYNVVPEAVEKPKDDRKEFYTVSYTTLVPVLTQAIQEQQAQIEELKKQNALLQARAATAEAAAATANATTDAFEARLRRLEAAGGQAQR